jgi:2,3-bisphosphoglycerate-dependent phosphoglycerate mutase
MKLYFVRHGQSEANLLKVISNRGLVHPLTELGRAQAAQLAQALTGLPITKIYSSPLLRAQQTAEIVSAALGLTFELADALREPDCGIAEGRSDEAAWAEHRQAWSAWLDEQRYDYRIEGGESYHDLYARFMPFIDRLLTEHGGTSDQIFLISHGQLLGMMLPAMLANATEVFAEPRSIPNTGLIVVERYSAGWVCVDWCGITFQRLSRWGIILPPS